MINARQLEVLCRVIEVGTTSGAAELLGVSQPAVSNMIRHTEDMTGLTLFVREHGRLVPTSEARRIAQEAQHLFMQQKRINSIVEELRGGILGKLNIVATPSIGLGLLPRLLSQFIKDRPKLNLSLELGSIDEVEDRLISGRADVGLAITRSRHSLLTVRPIGEGDMVLACPVGHELALMDEVEITSLNHYPHISYSASTPLGRAIDMVFEENGLERRYMIEVRHPAVALGMVIQGIGVALVDEFALIEHENKGVVGKRTRPRLPIELHAITSNLFPVSKVAREFIDAVAGHIKSKAAFKTAPG